MFALTLKSKLSRGCIALLRTAGIRVGVRAECYANLLIYIEIDCFSHHRVFTFQTVFSWESLDTAHYSVVKQNSFR